jgi:hypothetical protein
MGERERICEGPANGRRTSSWDADLYPAWLFTAPAVEEIVAGRSVALRTIIPHGGATLKYIAEKEPFAVMLEGVLYGSMAAAAIATGATPMQIHRMVRRING